MKSGYIIYAIISIMILLLYGMVLFFPWRLPEQSEPVECMIQKGMGSVRIGSLLKEHGIIRYPFLFRLSGQILYMNRNLQAGTYLFQGRMNHYSIIQKLRRGDVTSCLVILREGITAAQMAHILKEKIEIDSTAFMARVMDPVYARNSGIGSPTLEGYLFPDTYQFHSKASPDEVISRMLSRFHSLFGDSLKRRMEQLDMTLHEVVTLASIVEGEAVVDSERSIIAGIYHNRLKKRMRLQACPTIQYIIPDGPRRLLTKDLEIDSPYNTYLHLGLPPGPVNNPGMASVMAVLYPSETDYLYLVANGDGSHSFSVNMDEHIRAKYEFNLFREQVQPVRSRSGRSRK